jgi:quercetin dioxygenase-like cupin family protein
MLTVNLNEIPLANFVDEDHPQHRVNGTFPLYRAAGTENSALVYFELEPGDELGFHTDSAEETLFIVAGEVEVIVNDEKRNVSAGGLAVVPELAPHNIRNVGAAKAKVAGFFAKSDIVSVFEQPFAGIGAIFDTSKMPAPEAN